MASAVGGFRSPYINCDWSAFPRRESVRWDVPIYASAGGAYIAALSFLAFPVITPFALHSREERFLREKQKGKREVEESTNLAVDLLPPLLSPPMAEQDIVIVGTNSWGHSKVTARTL